MKQFILMACLLAATTSLVQAFFPEKDENGVIILTDENYN